ncbi:MAG: ABC transporter ATP-binding protein, partial [Anaerolineae bacterium]
MAKMTEQRQQPRPPRMHGPMGRHGAMIEKARDVRGALRRLLAKLQRYWLALAIVLVMVAASTLLGLVGPYLMGVAVDKFIAANDLAGLGRIVLLMLGSYLGSWVAQAIQGVIAARISQRVMRDMRRELFDHLQTLSLSFFDRRQPGELMSRLTNDLDAINRVLAQNVTALFGGLLTLVGILVMMFAINFWLALASLIVFPLMLGLVGFIGKRTRAGFREFQMRIGQLNGQLEEMFGGQRVIMAFGQEGRTLADFDAANDAVRRVGIHANSYAMLIPPLMGILSNANIAILAGLGGWMTLQGWATVGTIAAFYTYSRQFANPLRQLGDLYNQLQSALAGAERVFDLLDERPELADVPGAFVLDDITGEVVFDHVDFAYVEDVPVIKDMS